MKVHLPFLILVVLCAQVHCQFWKYSEQLFNPFSWIRHGKTAAPVAAPVAAPEPTKTTTTALHHLQQQQQRLSQSQQPQPASTTPAAIPLTNPNSNAGNNKNYVVASTYHNGTSAVASAATVAAAKVPVVKTSTTISGDRLSTTKRALKIKSTTPLASSSSVHPGSKSTSQVWTTVPITTQSPNKLVKNVTDKTATATVVTEATTLLDTTTQELSGTTEEPRDNHRVHDFYPSKREKPQVKIASNISQNLLPLPAGASAALVKPTKYHYYPHNQHIYLLPECAIQQVCNAVYVRLNWTQPLCACPSRYRDPCSASLNSDDLHTTELMVDRNSRRALTLVKTCEPTSEMRICRAPRDWSLLALQNIRTGKSHYLVICRCPDTSILEGPMSHDQPTYASVPGIRVYGMMCVSSSGNGNNKRRGRPLRLSRSVQKPPFPWHKVLELHKTANWDD